MQTSVTGCLKKKSLVYIPCNCYILEMGNQLTLHINKIGCGLTTAMSVVLFVLFFLVLNSMLLEMRS